MPIATAPLMNDHESVPDPVRAILRSPTLTRLQKIEALRQLAYDARERDVAAEEGMGGGGSDLAAVQRALRELGASDIASDAKQ